MPGYSKRPGSQASVSGQYDMTGWHREYFRSPCGWTQGLSGRQQMRD